MRPPLGHPIWYSLTTSRVVFAIEAGPARRFLAAVDLSLVIGMAI